MLYVLRAGLGPEDLADKASLTADALLAAAAGGPENRSTDPLADLTAELADFQRAVSLPGRLSLVGTMLQDATAPEARSRYQAKVVAPRRARSSRSCSEPSSSI